MRAWALACLALLPLWPATPAIAQGDGSMDAGTAKLYFPLERDVRWRYVVKPRGRVSATNAAEAQKIDGKKYTKQTVVMALPGSRAVPETRFLRLTGSGLVQYDNKAKTEQVLVPFPLKPGQTWVTKAGGSESKRTYVAMFNHTIGGIAWKNVIKIVADEGTRKIEMFYVKNIGLIGTVSKSGRTISLRSELTEVIGGKAGRVFSAKAGSWRAHSCDTGSLVVDMPGSPNTRSVRVGLGKKRVSGHQAGLKRGGETGFMVIHYALPDDLEKPTGKKTLNATAEAALKHVGGTVKKKRIKGTKHTFGGEKLVGRELKATVVRSGSEIEVVIRVLHSKTRGFQMIAFGNKQNMPKKDANKFLRSLRPRP